MRYTRRALLVFGAGLLFGLVIVVFEIKSLERVASAVMALGILALPIGMIVDWRRGAKALQIVEGRPPQPGKRPARRPASGKVARPRKPARPPRK